MLGRLCHSIAKLAQHTLYFWSRTHPAEQSVAVRKSLSKDSEGLWQAPICKCEDPHQWKSAETSHLLLPQLPALLLLHKLGYYISKWPFFSKLQEMKGKYYVNDLKLSLTASVKDIEHWSWAERRGQVSETRKNVAGIPSLSRVQLCRPLDCSMPGSSLLHYLMTIELCKHPFPPHSTFFERDLAPFRGC